MIANNTGGIGAERDIENYKRYFLSPEGGAWLPQEILSPLISPSASKLYSVLSSIQADKLDYLVIVFSGHGALTPDETGTYLCLRGEELLYNNYILDKNLLGYAARQLTILDCCRCKAVAQTFSESVKCAHIQPDIENNNRIRKLYESFISKTPQGNCIVYACARNQVAMGEDSIGGEFSSLMNYSDFIGLNRDSKKYAGITVDAAFKKVCATLRTNGIYPEIVKTPKAMGDLPWMMYPEHF